MSCRYCQWFIGISAQSIVCLPHRANTLKKRHRVTLSAWTSSARRSVNITSSKPSGAAAWPRSSRRSQPALERFVAVKVLLPQQAGTPEFRERFIREAKAIAQLNHPNILPIIDYGQADDLIYIVMKYVAGGTLADRLKHPIDLATTTRLIAQIAAALDHAHRRGIIHRDVKPSNVLLDENEWVQLADFGLAKITGKRSSVDQQRPEHGHACLSFAGTRRRASRSIGTPTSTRWA